MSGGLVIVAAWTVLAGAAGPLVGHLIRAARHVDVRQSTSPRETRQRFCGCQVTWNPHTWHWDVSRPCPAHKEGR